MNNLIYKNFTCCMPNKTKLKANEIIQKRFTQILYKNVRKKRNYCPYIHSIIVDSIRRRIAFILSSFYYAYNVDIPFDKYVYLQLHYLRYFVSD